jgi:phage gpG-like protein
MIIKTKGTVKFQKKLTNTSKLVKSNVILEALGQKLLNTMQAEYFPKGGTEEGRWQPNAPSTIAWKGSSVPLTGLEGDLRKRLQYQVVAHSKGPILEIGSPMDYAEYHQQTWEGHTFATPDHIPRRPFFPSKRKIEKEWTKIATNFLKKIDR